MRKENELYCRDCGKLMPVDEEKSNENWTVYETHCTCGGEPDIKRMLENGKTKKKSHD